MVNGAHEVVSEWKCKKGFLIKWTLSQVAALTAAEQNLGLKKRGKKKKWSAKRRYGRKYRVRGRRLR